MKRMMLLCLTAIILLSMTVGYAATVTEQSSSATTNVQYGVETAYTISLPDNMSLSGGSTDAGISINNATLPYNRELVVSLTSNSWQNNSWNLTNLNGGNQLAYTIMLMDATRYVTPDNNIVLSLPAGQRSASEVLVLKLAETPTIAGTYQDVCTFHVEMRLRGAAIFADGDTLSWDEVRTPSEAMKHGYLYTFIKDDVIQSDAFYGVTNLISISLPETIQTIEQDAFNFCTSLTSLTLPLSLTKIETGAFAKCTSLEYISYEGTIEQWNDIVKEHNAFDVANAFVKVQCSDGTIEAQAGISFTDGVFIPWSDIPNAEYDNKYEYDGTKVSNTRVKTGAFFNVHGMNSIILPDSITTIEDYAFEHCTDVQQVIIPRSVTSIGTGAFLETACVFYYTGTMAEWNAIPKRDYWYDINGTLQVICTDGNIIE